ncbi:hypothetical protein [Streptomyces spectabilis]|uniref:Putative membrane protein n=1 Tax=Streptomyces spectabilis TaxID=68270 RepID=A0A5P2X9N6_STRST|nr:hypothetical protein [Streptomyces spectabilis]MBB5109047.1 putative membrane protein [Streptomyces spectabilis]MCI3902690.1 hypothetical protein [Streptomyces spectabilis]QEV59999.1 hypothetical protein CP982_15680 [Streptomyces spectabilis]GGV44397.1 hypothetical protein GCM10010245_69420 [Streptomyces spectabilis]
MINEGTALSLSLIFGVITVFLVRSRDMRVHHAICAVLLGVYLGQTPVALSVHELITWLTNGFSQH